MCIRVWPGLTTITTKVLLHTLTYTHKGTASTPNCFYTPNYNQILWSLCSSGSGYRWFILGFIKETGVPLKRDQSATRHEQSASNWSFIKKPSQVDRSAEISRMPTEPRYINYATDEPRALQPVPCDSREAGKRADAHAPGHTLQEGRGNVREGSQPEHVTVMRVQHAAFKIVVFTVSV